MRSLLYIIVLNIYLMAVGQQLPGLSHFAADPFLINPAAVGTSGNMAGFYYANYFSDINGAPQTQLFNYQANIHERNFALGFSIYNDHFNIIGRTGASVSSAYKVRFRPSHSISFGLTVEALHNRVYFDRIIADDGVDPILLGQMDSRVSWEGAAGIYYRLFDFRLGLSAQQLFQNQLEYQLGDQRSIGYRLLRHYQLHGSWQRQVTAKLEFQADIMGRAVQGLPASLVLQTKLAYTDKVWTGLLFESSRSAGMLMGVELSDQYIISYVIKQPFGELAQAFGLYHEFRLAVRLGKKSHLSGPKNVSESGVNSIQVIIPESSELNQLKLAYDQIQAELEDLKNNSWSEKPVERKDRPYYVVTGTFSTARNARLYQKLFYKETGIKTEVIKENRHGYYLVYADTVRTIKDGNKKIKKLLKGKSNGFMMGTPWLYKKND